MKIQRIHEIHLAGFQAGHVIHRHGMDEKTALHVEGALIDAYPGLMNIADGHGSNDYGAMHTQQLIQSYLATTANFEKHKVMMISVNRTATSMNLYEAVRYAWKIDIRKARQADVVLATQVGIIKGVFIAEEWLEATSENFPWRNTMHGRFGFRGKEADVDIKILYLGKGVPDVFRKKGASNPIKYTWNRSQYVAPK